jgi:hypothetical protein
MKNYYILITSDSNDLEALAIFKKRIAEKKWPLYEKTTYLKKIATQDEIVFYLAGKGSNAQSFIGTAVVNDIHLNDNLLVDPDKDRNVVNRYLILNKIITFPNPIKIKSILDKLEFIKNKKNYGAYLIGGVAKFNEQDFLKISN